MVQPDELLVRALHLETHIKKSGKLKDRAFIPYERLKSGELSVWRLGHLPDSQPSAVAAFLGTRTNLSPDKHPIKQVWAVRASDVRAILVSTTRALCVVDDTTTAIAPPEHHEAHACIQLCASNTALQSVTDENDLSYLAVREGLIEKFRLGVLFEAA